MRVSDHQLVSFGVSGGGGAIRDMWNTCRRVNWELLRARLEAHDWSGVEVAESADLACDYLQKDCQTIMTDCSTTINLPPKFRALKEWVNPGLVRLIRIRQGLYSKYKKSKFLAHKIVFDCFKTILNLREPRRTTIEENLRRRKAPPESLGEW